MERDLRQTPLFQEIEALYRSILEPGFGRPTTFGDPLPSPDGAWVVVTGTVRTSLDEAAHGRLFLVPAAGGTVRQLTYGPNDDTGPQWSPDGSRLTFCSDRGSPGRFQLHELSFGDVGEARPLTEVPGVVEHHRWSPDGARILMVVAGEASEQADALGSGSLGKGDGDLPAWIPDVDSSDSDDEWRMLWVLDVADGAVRRCSRPGLNVWEATWLGVDHAAAVASEAPSEGAWYGSALVVVDLEAGQEREVLRSPVQLGYAEGRADGAAIAVLQGVASDRYLVAGDLLLVDPTTSAVNTVDTAGVDVTSATWRRDQTILAAGMRGFDAVVLQVDRAGVASETYSTRECLSQFQPRIEALGTGFVAAMSSSSRPPAVVRVDGGAVDVLIDGRHSGQDTARGGWGNHEVISWTAPDGQEIQGRLATPSGPGPYPLLLNVHGGPIWQFKDDWLLLHEHLLLSRGYAILFPNPRGSTGRGQTFAQAVVGDMGGADSYDLLSGVDQLVADGIADPDRIGIFGGSYGGFMAAWLPTLDTRFKAAVALSPVTDWYSEHFGSSLIDWVGDFLADRPERVGGAYHERSPVLAGDRLRTPTLLTAGLRDRATPPTQAVEFYRALVAQGVPSEAVIYPQEGHGIRSLLTQVDLATRMVTWFERFMPAR